MSSVTRLLLPDEPAAFHVENEQGRSPFLITCDHAGRRIPQRLGSLGVAASELTRHIAWDIGAAEVALKLAALLDAVAILQTYSRLVIDCNRPLTAPGSIVTLSEHTDIPGNHQLSAADIAARTEEIFWPYHRRIHEELEARLARSQATILIAMHSFTPQFKSQTRSMQVGVLYQRDTRLAHRLRDILRQDSNLIVGDNEPYAVSDATDYAIPVYGEQRGLLHVEIEIRQDLIADDDGQTDWAERMAKALLAATSDVLPQ